MSVPSLSTRGRSALLLGVIALALLALGGCGLFFSPVPRASIAYLKSLPGGALQEANPQDVRLAVNLPAGVEIMQPSIAVSGEYGKKTLATNLSFQKILESGELAAAPSGGSGRWTYYALTEQGKEGFKKLQGFVPTDVNKNSGGPKMTLTVHIHNKLALTDCDRGGSVPLLVAILLDPKHGYVTVWDHAVSLSKLAKPKDRICSGRSN